MSGICGVWTFDGSDPLVDPVLASLERRGPDGTRSWTDGVVALGHTSLATTPEALIEVLPLFDGDTGCTITADARIDNRDDLIAALELRGETRTIGDGELILGAYLRWGEDCPAHLRGDYAFAIWDSRKRRLFCARDHMGMRQLNYFYAPGRQFVFATEAEAVLAQTSVPKKINEGRIADYLDNLEGLDRTSTFFEDIFRLPAAHTLTVDAGEGLSIRPYWRLSPNAELKLPNDDAYAAAFLDVLTEAVRCRLRSPTPIGSMLSGGMDSGAIVAIAARLLITNGNGPLSTFSAVGADAEGCVETRAIRSAASLPGLTPHFVTLQDIAKDQPILAVQSPGTEPFDSHMILVRAVYLAAHRAGIRVMLDGVAGDVVLTSGNRVAQLLRQGRLLAAIQDARGAERFWGNGLPSWKILVESAWAAYVPSPIRDLRHSLIAAWRDSSVRSAGLIGPLFARRTDLACRRKQHRRHVPASDLSVTERRAGAIDHPHMVVARERYDRVASALAIEPRDPFMDLRVVEFCLALPPEQLQVLGWPKMILRRAMKDLLPHEVIWRRGKEHLGWEFTKTLFESSPGWEEELRERRSEFYFFLSSAGKKMLRQPATDASAPHKHALFFLLRWMLRIRSVGSS